MDAYAPSIYENDPVRIKLGSLGILLNSLTLNRMIDWQACSRPNDSLGRTALGFKLVRPLRIDGKDYWISLYRLRFPDDDGEGLNLTDLEVTCLQDGNTENFRGYWSVSLAITLIEIAMEERRPKEGISEEIGDKKEKQIKLLDKVIESLDAAFEKVRNKT